MSEARKGKKRTEETRRKLSEAMTGENNPNYGKGVLSKDICAEIYNTRKILKITQAEMAEQLGISRTTVQKAEKIVKEMLVNGNI